MTAPRTYKQLADRWMKAEGPTKKASTLELYRNVLRRYPVPGFGHRPIKDINREEIQRFLTEKSKTYSRATLRTMRVTLGLTLGWAHLCGWIKSNPCLRIKLPVNTGGHTVSRTVLTADQISQISLRLEEPLSTLILLLGATGLRIGEAIAIKWTDIHDRVLHVSRRVYHGGIDTLKSKRAVRRLPLSDDLVERIREIGAGHEWVFRSLADKPLSPENALKRHVRPVVRSLGIEIGGWHDFRHTLSTTLRRGGVHPKVVSDILGHSKVNLAMDVYDRTELPDFVQPLHNISSGLLIDVTKTDPLSPAKPAMNAPLTWSSGTFQFTRNVKKA